MHWGNFGAQVGFLVGASLLILVLSFEGALYWVRRLVQSRALKRRNSDMDPLCQQGLIAKENGRREAASVIACGFHSAIFVIQLVVTIVVVKAKEDVIDTYAGTFACIFTVSVISMRSHLCDCHSI